MKKLLCILLLFVNVLTFTSCRKDIPKKPADISRDIADYFPFEKDVLKVYESYGDEHIEKTVLVDYINNSKIQLRTITPETVTVSVLKYEDGKLQEIYSKEEFYHIANMTNVMEEKNNTILKEPLRVGSNWSLPDGYKRAITGYDVEIETPMGRYKALEVTTEYGDNKREIDYYVKKMGHVARLYKDNKKESKIVLKSIKKDQAHTFRLRVYYPIIGKDRISFAEKSIKFNTNDRMEKIFEREFKNNPSKEVLPSISQNTQIKKINFRQNDDLVKVDFSKELLQEMNVKDVLEIQKIRCIVNTIGGYYGADKVYISVEGKPYSSKNFKLEDGEYFNVDDKYIIPFKAN